MAGEVQIDIKHARVLMLIVIWPKFDQKSDLLEIYFNLCTGGVDIL